jgi:DNA-binding HxlR family transcriptional regulator
MSQYNQYCPLALAAEVFCERWNVLILRKIIEGNHGFNKIHQGVPKITASLLSSRLKDLALAGIIERTPNEGSRGYQYHLTEAGEELAPIIQQLADWGQAWARDMVIEDLDPEFLLFQMHSRLNTDLLPDGRTVIAMEFTGTPRGANRFWLVHESCDVDMCLKNPGHDPNLTIRSDLRLFVEAWRGFRNLRQEIGLGNIRLEGDSNLVKMVPDLLLLSAAARVERKRPGAERNLRVSSTC